MIQNLYQEYIYLVGRLKDIHALDVDVNHKDIHTFYKNKIPMFKLLFGEFSKTKELNIVVSFHIDVKVTDAILWFINIQNIYPLLKVAEVYIDDDKGETYLGEDAELIRNLKFEREVLDQWLSSKGEDEMKEFVKSKIIGNERDYKKSYDSQGESEKAIMDFEFIKPPDDDGDVH